MPGIGRNCACSIKAYTSRVPRGVGAAMSESQRKASAYISFAALLVASIISVWLAHLAATSSFATAHPGQDEPVLLESWTAIVWFMKSSTSAKVIYGGLLTILTIGTGVLGEIYKSTRAILFLAVLCLIGIAACTTVIIEVTKPDNLTTFRYYADYDELAHLESDVNILFGALIGWFTSFLASQLGIRLAVKP